jgi:hypothetical protein
MIIVLNGSYQPKAAIQINKHILFAMVDIVLYMSRINSSLQTMSPGLAVGPVPFSIT